MRTPTFCRLLLALLVLQQVAVRRGAAQFDLGYAAEADSVDYLSGSLETSPFTAVTLISPPKLHFIQKLVVDLTRLLNGIISFLQGVFGVHENAFTRRALFDAKNIEFLTFLLRESKQLFDESFGLANIFTFDMNTMVEFLLSMPGFSSVKALIDGISSLFTGAFDASTLMLGARPPPPPPPGTDPSAPYNRGFFDMPASLPQLPAPPMMMMPRPMAPFRNAMFRRPVFTHK